MCDRCSGDNETERVKDAGVFAPDVFDKAWTEFFCTQRSLAGTGGGIPHTTTSLPLQRMRRRRAAPRRRRTWA